MVQSNAPAEIYQLHILLLQINPPIWRRLHVRSDSSIATLHELLQIAFDWSDFHLHRFVIRGWAMPETGDPRHPRPFKPKKRVPFSPPDVQPPTMPRKSPIHSPPSALRKRFHSTSLSVISSFVRSWSLGFRQQMDGYGTPSIIVQLLSQPQLRPARPHVSHNALAHAAPLTIVFACPQH